MTIFIVIYLLALICYFHTRVTDNKLYRVVNKYIMASMYLIFAIVTFFNKPDHPSYQIILMIGLLFAFLGDIFLAFDFVKGGLFFLTGNIFFIIYELRVLSDHGYPFKDIWWIFLISTILIGLFIFLCNKYPEIIKMGKMRWPMTIYLYSIITHGFIGLLMVILLPDTNYAMMGIGSFLFMISDMILTAYRFIYGNNKWLIRANSLTYFVGLLLIVLSTAK